MRSRSKGIPPMTSNVVTHTFDRSPAVYAPGEKIRLRAAYTTPPFGPAKV